MIELGPNVNSNNLRCDLSIVSPIYCCAPCLRELYQRIKNTVERMPEIKSFEIIFVDDSSPDNAWSIIREMSRADSRCKGIRLTRNFGQHQAITAGLQHSQGDWVVVMDCDLQDRPEAIANLWSKKNEGFDIVFAARKKRTHGFLREIFAKAHAYFLKFVSGKVVESSHGTFSLISRRVVNDFNQFRERKRHYSYIIKWLGYPMSEIVSDQDTRFAGKSSYTFWKLFRHSLDGFLFQAQDALRFIVYVGLSFGLAGLILAGFFIYRYLIESALPGWTSLAVLILVCSGVISMSLGFVGMYVGEIFEQIKGRPLFVVETTTDSLSNYVSNNLSLTK